MDWTMNADEDFPPDVHATRPEERDIVPIGRHTATIKHAEEGPNKFKQCDANPDGNCLKLRLAVGDYRFIFHDLPKHLPWLGKQLADALGIQPDGTTLRLVPAEIKDREVEVEVEHYTSKAGKLSAVVKRYLPGKAAATPAPKPAAQPPARTPAAKVRAASPDIGSDDIPF